MTKTNDQESAPQSRGSEVREKLLEAGAELIPELGWNGVSTRKLAERAEVRSGLVHYHFDSLQDLLCQSAMRVIRETLGAVGGALALVDQPEDAVDAMLAHIDMFSGLDPTSLLFAETYLQATRDERLRDEFTTATVEFQEEVGQFLERHNISSDGPALTFMSALDGFVLHKALNPSLAASTMAPSLKQVLRSESGAA
ncbi:TetR/AcrR family transcriptional regulator [Haloglycomyces albus]|uniref:TetR/AcrR family transcriptional regulator n=1 Tax=Haloglycomyces albus TaxID=526067 RepID=UPI00046CD3A6|nr:TetR/AcrR family transcriptional regulator [Haloglycomyces albus]